MFTYITYTLSGPQLGAYLNSLPHTLGTLPMSKDIFVTTVERCYWHLEGASSNAAVNKYSLNDKESSQYRCHQCKTENITTHLPMGWMLYALIFQNLLLIMVFKCFNLPSSPPPTRGSGEEKLIGQRRVWTCLEIVLWANPICIDRISAGQFT